MTSVHTARRLRQSMTLPEVLLWRELKGRRGPVRFRRQHRLAEFVIDFYCPGAKLAIEVDGIVHDMGDRPQKDLEREAVIESHGLEVLRIAASEVLADPVAVAEGLVTLCEARVAEKKNPSVSR